MWEPSLPSTQIQSYKNLSCSQTILTPFSSNHNNTLEYDYDPEGPYGPFDNMTIDYDDYDEIGHTEILSGINSVITGSSTFCEGTAIFKKNDGTEKR